MASESELMDYPETADFYSLLALQRDPPPTDAQIRSAYHRLSRSFHPDKQTAEFRDTAMKQYNRIRMAHDTLLDPKKRVVYDMLGEEGVRAEWEAGGTMGPRGEAEKQQVGVKAMDAAQFRSWFLATMKKRERKALEDLVRSKGLVRLHIDARPMFFQSTDPDAPILKPKSFSLGFNFATPFPLLNWFQKTQYYEAANQSREEYDEDQTVAETDDENMDLHIHAAVGGEFKPMVQRVTLADEETGEEETRTVDLPLTLLSSNVSFGSTFQRSVRGTEANRDVIDRILHPVFGDSVVQFGASALPALSFQTIVNKSVTLVKNTSPVQLTLQTDFSRSPLRLPPTLHVSATRNFGENNLMYGNWSSGVLYWPHFVEKLFSLAVEPTPEDAISYLMRQPSSGFELGFSSITSNDAEEQPKSEADEEDFPISDDSEHSADTGPTSDPVQFWRVGVHTSPMALQLSAIYSRDLFAGKSEEPKLRGWNLEGYYPRKEAQRDRSVRLHVSTTVSADLSLSWTVTGTRQIGDFTCVGLGVGIESPLGLVVSLTWRRLGQSIKFPVALCPLEYANDVAPLAVIVPWLTYSVVEFGFVRPRQRRKRRQLVSRQSKRLKRVVGERQRESREAINMIREQVERKQAKEDAKDGLVILQAEYGRVVSAADRYSGYSESADSSEMSDVTIPVAALVDQSQLVIPRNVVKAHIIGFYDPAPLLPKVLRVRYRFAGKEHSVEVDDSESLTCPMRSHML